MAERKPRGLRWKLPNSVFAEFPRLASGIVLLGETRGRCDNRHCHAPLRVAYVTVSKEDGSMPQKLGLDCFIVWCRYAGIFDESILLNREVVEWLSGEIREYLDDKSTATPEGLLALFSDLAREAQFKADLIGKGYIGVDMPEPAFDTEAEAKAYARQFGGEYYYRVIPNRNWQEPPHWRLGIPKEWAIKGKDNRHWPIVNKMVREEAEKAPREELDFTIGELTVEEDSGLRSEQ